MTSIFRQFGRHRLLLCLLLLTGMQCQSAASAEALGIPNKEIVIYLDNSASIVRNSNNPPSEQLASMLIDLFSPKTGFLNDNDQISLMAFGPSFHASFTRSNMVGKDGDWRNLIEDFGKPREGDDETDFRLVFEDIQQRVEASQNDQNLRIFIIASDFVHDPNNDVSSSKLGSMSDARNTTTRLWRDAKASLDQLANSTSASFVGNDGRNFLLLLRTDPYVTSNSNNFYRTTSRDIGQLLTNGLADQLNATTLRYTPGQMSADSFAEAIRSKLTRWLSFRVMDMNEKANGQVDMRLQVINSNSFPVTLKSISLALDAQANPIPVKIKAATINPGDRNFLNITDLEPVFHQENLYFYPTQDPEPSGTRHVSQATDLSFVDASIESLSVKYLLSHTPSLLIEADIKLNNATIPSVDFMLLRIGTQDLNNDRDTYFLERNYQIPLSNGAGRSRVRLQLDDTNFNYDAWDTFSFAVALGDQQTPFIKKESLQAHSANFKATLPGPVSIALSLFFFVLLVFASYLTTPGQNRKGLADPVVWFAFLCNLIHLPCYWFFATSLGWDVFYFLAFFPAIQVSLIFLRLRASGFEKKLPALAESVEIVPEQRQANFLTTTFLLMILISAFVGYLIYLFLS